LRLGLFSHDDFVGFILGLSPLPDRARAEGVAGRLCVAACVVTIALLRAACSASFPEVYPAIAGGNLEQAGRWLAFLDVGQLPGPAFANALNGYVKRFIEPNLSDDLSILVGDLPVFAGAAIDLLRADIPAGRVLPLSARVRMQRRDCRVHAAAVLPRILGISLDLHVLVLLGVQHVRGPGRGVDE